MSGYFSAYHLFTDTLDSFKYCKIIRYKCNDYFQIDLTG